ncbi:MAG: hypothetical protein AAB489_00800 [Patescibacteria group bacterium]
MYGILSVAMESFITLDGPLLRLDEAFRRFHLLDHPKNLDGLLAACDELRAAGFRGDDLEHAFLDIVIPILKEWPDAEAAVGMRKGATFGEYAGRYFMRVLQEMEKRGDGTLPDVRGKEVERPAIHGACAEIRQRALAAGTWFRKPGA